MMKKLLGVCLISLVFFSARTNSVDDNSNVFSQQENASNVEFEQENSESLVDETQPTDALYSDEFVLREPTVNTLIQTAEAEAEARTWISEHKALTITIVATLIGAVALAGTLYFCPTVRENVTTKIKAVGTFASTKAHAGWTLCMNNKKYSIPAAAVSLIVVSLTTYDLCQDSEESYIKSFINHLLGCNKKTTEQTVA